MSTINVNYMSHIKNYVNTYASKSKASADITKTMTEKVAERKQASEVSAVSGAAEVSGEDMTMAEYKAYISDKISRIPINPSLALNSIAVNISEKGFEAMKKDPEYEEWVLDMLEKDFAVHDPWSAYCGGSYTIHNFGETKNDYRGMGWYKGYQNGNGEKLFNERSKGSFWNRKVSQKNQMEQLYKKQQEKRQLQKRADEKARMENHIMETALSSYEANFNIL